MLHMSQFYVLNIYYEASWNHFSVQSLSRLNSEQKTFCHFTGKRAYEQFFKSSENADSKERSEHG